MHKLSLPLLAMLALSSLAGCSGDKGDPGAPGTRGSDGTNGMDGEDGTDGTDGTDGEDGMMGLPGPGSVGEGVTEIALFGEFFFPEGVAAAPDGTLYVGSLGTGQIIRVPAGTFKAEPFIDGGADTYGTVGMIVDAASDTLWACTIDLNFMLPSQLKAFNLTSGQETASHDYPAGGVCNDVAIDAQGNVYATDSFLGVIRRVPAGGDTLEEWANDPIFQAPVGEFGMNGIVWDGMDLWAVNLFNTSLYHIAIEGDGSSGAVTEITLDQPLLGPDGIKARGPGSLIIVDNGSGTVKEVIVTGDTGAVTTLRNGMDVPTTGDFAYGDMWVAEGQFDHLFGTDPNPPDLPFKVKRVVLP